MTTAAVDYALLMEQAARALCGDPNLRLSTKTELRFGTNGSLSVDLAKGTWFDHEANVGGGLLDLVGRECGLSERREQFQWLVQNGLAVETASVCDATYNYVDEHGVLLFQVVRLYPKTFRQRRPEGGGWVGSVKGVRQVPYRLPELQVLPTGRVYVVEGEKDVDRLAREGLLATCSAGGSGSAQKVWPQIAPCLRDREVVILPDNDEAGRKYAKAALAALQGVARSVRVVELPGLPDKGDVSNWLDAGHTAEELERLAADAPAAEAPLRLVPLTGLMEERFEEWPHVIRPYFPRKVTTLLAGHGGLGKSMLALILAAHVAAGRPWGPFEVEQGKAVFLSFEDEGHLVRARLRRTIEHYGLPVGPTLGNLLVFDGSDAEAEMAVEDRDGLIFTPMAGLVEQAVAGAAFVIIDNASDTYGGNEIARRQVRQFVRRLTQMARTNQAAVVLLAHVDKLAAKGGGKGNNYSGSSQWHNSVRSRLALLETEIGIELLHEKANYAPRHGDLLLSRAAHGVLEIAPSGQREAAATAVANADAEAVLAVMAALIADGTLIPTAETGQRTTYHVLSQAPELPEQLRGSAGKARVKAAVLALSRAKRIQRETYRTPDRKEKERWTLAHSSPAEAA